MPDAEGNIKGIAVPRIPYRDGKLAKPVEAVCPRCGRHRNTCDDHCALLDTAESVQADQDTSGPGWPE
jgi:hypothetical protein